MSNLKSILKQIPKVYYTSSRRFDETSSINENKIDLKSNKNSVKQKYTDYSTTSPYLIPDYYNPLVSDLEEERDIESLIAKELNVQYLSHSFEKTKPIIEGMICSKGKSLPFVNLICQSKGQDPINVIFLLATGSPFTYMTDKALSFTLSKPKIGHETDIIKVDDYVMTVKRSNFPNSTFKNLNVLGLDFLKNSNLIKLEKKHFFLYK